MAYKARYNNSPIYNTYSDYVNTQQDLLNPIGMVTNTVAGIGNTMDEIAEQKALQQTGRPDLADYVVGNSWSDIINNKKRVSQGLDIINDSTINYSNIKNNNNLLNSWDSNDLQDYVNTSGPSAGQVFGDTLGDMGKYAGIGASVGSIIPGVGTAIGAGVGAVAGILSGIGRTWLGAEQNNKNTKMFNRAIDTATAKQINNFYDTSITNNQRQNKQNMMNYFADGGSLEELNNVTKVNAGSTHENNPYDGVQMGIASDGLPNKVEEGELIFNDYVYSNRLKPSKKLLKDNLLPEKYQGLTYAKVAEKLQKESEDRPNDPISKTTLDEWMSRLANAQELHKQQLEERKLAKELDYMSTKDKAVLMQSLMQQQAMTQQEVPQDTMQQGINLGQPVYAHGGSIYIDPKNKGKFTATKERTGKTTEELTHSKNPLTRKRAIFAQNAAKWSHNRSIGGPNNPYSFYNQISEEPQFNLLEQLANNVATDTHPYRFGMYNISEPYLIKNSLNDISLDDLVKLNKTSSTDNNGIVDIPKPTFNAVDYVLNEDKNNINNNDNKSLPTYLRYAPAIGATLGAIKSALQPVDYRYPNELRDVASRVQLIAAPTLGGYRRYIPYDVNLGNAENLANQAAAVRVNRGQNRAIQSALNIGTINAYQKANAARNVVAQQANEALREAVDKYNLGIDQTNANLISTYDDLNNKRLATKFSILTNAATAADAARTGWSQSYDSAVTNMYNQLGNVGMDNWRYNQFLQWLKAHPATKKQLESN